jgi:multiple sugar transport system permease protein
MLIVPADRHDGSTTTADPERRHLVDVGQVERPGRNRPGRAPARRFALRPGGRDPAAAGRTGRAGRGRRQRIEVTQAWVLLIPILAALILLRIYPVVEAIVDSFKGPHGYGFGNYTFLFGQSQFRQSLLTTLIFNAIVNPFQILVALALAMLLTRKVPMRALWRALIFAPVAMPMPVTAVVWSQILGQKGPANGLFKALGIPPQGFFTSGREALLSIIILASWIGVGLWMVFLIAGIQEIPTTLYDAASVDGAGPFRRFWSVTLPLLRRPLAFVLVADTVANLVLFAPVQIITNGGPLNATNLLMYSVFQQAYTNSATNIAAAETLILVVASLLVVVLEFRFLRPRT